ncbi:MAG: sulfotransferase [Pseudomonadota bacterium]
MGPLFILGFPRSGTTAMVKAVAALGRFGGYEREGHFLYLFAASLARIQRGEINENSVLHGEGAQEALYGGFTATANTLYSATNDPQDTCWIDKTPDVAQVRAVPVIDKLWPNARYIFLYRPAQDAVRSSFAVWRNRLEGKEIATAERWVQCHRAWRAARPAIQGRYREVYQPHMLSNPQKVAQSLKPLLSLTDEEVSTLATLWREDTQVNRPRGERAKAYDAVTLADDIVDEVQRVTQDEVAHWPVLMRAGKENQA